MAIYLPFLTSSDFRFHLQLWRRIKYTYVPNKFVWHVTFGTRAIAAVDEDTLRMDRHEQGFTYLPQTWDTPQNSRRHCTKFSLHCTKFSRHCTKFSRHGDLAHGIFAPMDTNLVT
jgi:hypothetical protein